MSQGFVGPLPGSTVGYEARLKKLFATAEASGKKHNVTQPELRNIMNEAAPADSDQADIFVEVASGYKLTEKAQGIVDALPNIQW